MAGTRLHMMVLQFILLQIMLGGTLPLLYSSVRAANTARLLMRCEFNTGNAEIFRQKIS
jgi:hypothetical protein